MNLLFKQIRIHQWTKNFLLFVPALSSHQIIQQGVFINTIKGFLAFSMIASSVYVLNDIIDIDEDRKHPTKKNRPIAAGDLPMSVAYTVLIVFFLMGLLLSINLGITFLILTSIYIILNLAYSLYLKKIIILDIIMLMFFYNLRVIAGHVPDSIPFSPWLLSFSLFLFFSLGLLKRYVDTIIISKNNKTFLDGRSYSIDDGNILMSLGTGSGLISVLVLILYTASEQVKQLYATPLLLIALAPLMLYWIGRMWLMAERGKIKSDPVLFAVKDIHSYVVAFCCLTLMLISRYLFL